MTKPLGLDTLRGFFFIYWELYEGNMDYQSTKNIGVDKK